MKRLKLTKGYFALISNKDYKRVSKYKWQAHVDSRSKLYTVYARCTVIKEQHQPTAQLLHRFVLGVVNPKIKIDHKDGNGLNCQRRNLRVVTHAQNIHNSRVRSDSISGLKGVGWHKLVKKWQARIIVKGCMVHLGWFVDKKEAAKAYDKATRKYYGKFAAPNKEKQ